MAIICSPLSGVHGLVLRVVLGEWLVARSDVCEGEVVIDGQRIYFDVWVEPKPE